MFTLFSKQLQLETWQEAYLDFALENWQADHQTSMVEIECTIKGQPIPILIDTGASLSYTSPKIFELCKFVPEKFDNMWLVKLATYTKHKVTRFVKNCELLMNDLITHIDFNILPLGYYDILIRMDWL